MADVDQGTCLNTELFAQGTNFSLVNCRPQNWRPEQAVIQFGAAAAWLGRRVKKISKSSRPNWSVALPGKA